MAVITPAVPLDSIMSISITNGSTVTRGSGVLFASGNYILTAAHVFDSYINGQSIGILSANGTTLNAGEIYKHHSWVSSNSDINHDIAIIELTSTASDQGLSLRRDDMIIGQSFTLTGFGNEGSLHTGTNIFDADASLFNDFSSKNIVETTQVVYDYDNGLEHQNTSKNLFGVNSSSLATGNETLAKSGDSGGGLLIDNEIAAISSYAYRNPLYDVNDVLDFCFGELSIATQIYPYIPWIDYITQGNPNYLAPSIVSNVATTVAEPFSGSVINHFLLSTSSIRSETVIFNYSTRGGTATAGLDYQHTQGTVELHPYETAIAIEVVIYGDTLAEVDETFSLVLTDPTNEWLGIDVELIATHTIMNNDIFIV